LQLIKLQQTSLFSTQVECTGISLQRTIHDALSYRLC